MTYIPKTEAQLAQEALLEDGEYDFEVIDTSDNPSKKGNDMFTLKLSVFGNDGSQRHIFDYMAMGNFFGERKLRHASVACGILEQYDAGNLQAHDFIGKCGKILLKQQKGSDDFPLPKNVVADYLERKDGAEPPVKKQTTAEIIDDEIPFAWVVAFFTPFALLVASHVA